MLDMDRRHLSGAGYLLASPALMKKITHQPKTPNPARTPKKAGQEAIVVGRPNRTTGPGFDYLVCQPSGLDKVPHTPGDAITPRGLPLVRQEGSAQKPPLPPKPSLPQKPTPEKKVKDRPTPAPQKKAGNIPGRRNASHDAARKPSRKGTKRP
jgi:hypothetical protein